MWSSLINFVEKFMIMKYKKFLEKLASEVSKPGTKVELLKEKNAFIVDNQIFEIEEKIGENYQSEQNVKDFLMQLEKSNFSHSKLIKNNFIKYLCEKGVEFTLVGGAVIDIFEGRCPKDYDFTQIPDSILEEGSLVDASSTADTYIVKGNVVQKLHTSKADFEFSVSQNEISSLTFNKYRNPENQVQFLTCTLPECKSYKSKLLVPVSYKRDRAINALLRIPHWRKKGFNITDNTYRSLVVAAAGEPEYLKRVLGKNS